MLGVLIGALLLLLMIGLVVLQGAIEWYDFDPDAWLESIFKKKDTAKTAAKKDEKKTAKPAAKKKRAKR